MTDVSAQFTDTRDPGAYDYTIVGTAAGTTTIRQEPCFFQGVAITNRVASGKLIFYDSVGTSSTIIGTITMGTSTAVDAPETQIFKVATKNALTVENSANMGAVVLFK